MNDERFAPLIDRIYEAALAPEMWPQVLDEIAGLCGAFGGILFTAGENGTRWTASEPFAPIVSRWLAEGWNSRNPRPGRALALQRAGFMHDLDLFTPDELDHDPMYGYLRQEGFGWCAGTLVQAPTGDVLVFSWERRFATGAFDDTLVRSFDPLRPHLARAGLLAARLGLERARGAADALGILGLPAAVLYPGGRAMAVNAAMNELEPLVVTSRRRFQLSDPNADAILARHLAMPVGAWLRQAVSIPIARTNAAPAMIAHLVPLRGAAHDIFTGAMFLLVLTPLTGPRVAAAELLEGLFDLTATEAQVARLISLGRTINDVASLHGVAESTVRTHLKAIFAKTGASRQIELMALLAAPTLPAEERT